MHGKLDQTIELVTVICITVAGHLIFLQSARNFATASLLILGTEIVGFTAGDLLNKKN